MSSHTRKPPIIRKPVTLIKSRRQRLTPPPRTKRMPFVSAKLRKGRERIKVAGTRDILRKRTERAQQIKKIRAFQIKKFGPRVGRKAARSFVTGRV